MVRVACLVLAIFSWVPQLWGQTLIGGELQPNSLVSVNPNTATTQEQVSLNFLPQGLAYDPQTDSLYAISAASSRVYLIDQNTGESSVIADLPYQNANGLAFDTTRGLLFGSDNITNALFTIDPKTSTLTEIGIIAGGELVEGLAFDPKTETLYGLADLQNELIAIDRDTAVATTVLSGMPSCNWRGLAFDQTHDVLYASVSVSGSLYRIEGLAETPSLVEIGHLSPGKAIQGLAFIVPEPSMFMLLSISVISLVAYNWRRR